MVSFNLLIIFSCKNNFVYSFVSVYLSVCILFVYVQQFCGCVFQFCEIVYYLGLFCVLCLGNCVFDMYKVFLWLCVHMCYSFVFMYEKLYSLCVYYLMFLCEFLYEKEICIHVLLYKCEYLQDKCKEDLGGGKARNTNLVMHRNNVLGHFLF